MQNQIFLCITEDTEAFRPSELGAPAPDFRAITIGSTSLDPIFENHKVNITRFIEIDPWADVTEANKELILNWQDRGHEIGLHVHQIPPQTNKKNLMLEFRKQPIVFDVLDIFRKMTSSSSKRYTSSPKTLAEYDHQVVKSNVERAVARMRNLKLKPLSFRAGSFKISYPLLEAMIANGIENSSNSIPVAGYYRDSYDYGTRPYWLSRDEKLWHHPERNRPGLLCPESAGPENETDVLEVPLPYHPKSRGPWSILNLDYPFLVSESRTLLKEMVFHLRQREGVRVIVLQYHSWAAGVLRPNKRYLRRWNELLGWIRNTYPSLEILKISEVRERLTE